MSLAARILVRLGQLTTDRGPWLQPRQEQGSWRKGHVSKGECASSMPVGLCVALVWASRDCVRFGLLTLLGTHQVSAAYEVLSDSDKRR